MDNAQQTLELEQAEAGMTLADDVFDANGGVLVSAGTELTDKLIQILRRREIKTLEVNSPELDAESRLSRRQAIEQRLERQYAPFNSPTMDQLKELFRHYHTRGLS
ncbi:hypothetical protein [Motiliproteus sediminis]|uniref:hypothetical protein n=1 Tax=Motiliproteus sediminis TaxID=1468178 RepID=UPI001AEF460F|nr:hypothetical protein [Motiliproteus sediminis]